MIGTSEKRLENAIAALLQQRDCLKASGAAFAAHLIGLAVFELRLKLHDVSDAEFSDLCDSIESRAATQERGNLPGSIANLDDYRWRRLARNNS